MLSANGGSRSPPLKGRGGQRPGRGKATEHRSIFPYFFQLEQITEPSPDLLRNRLRVRVRIYCYKLFYPTLPTLPTLAVSVGSVGCFFVSQIAA